MLTATSSVHTYLRVWDFSVSFVTSLSLSSRSSFSIRVSCVCHLSPLTLHILVILSRFSSPADIRHLTLALAVTPYAMVLLFIHHDDLMSGLYWGERCASVVQLQAPTNILDIPVSSFFFEKLLGFSWSRPSDILHYAQLSNCDDLRWSGPQVNWSVQLLSSFSPLVV